jgi:hypothetical protein
MLDHELKVESWPPPSQSGGQHVGDSNPPHMAEVIGLCIVSAEREKLVASP